MPSRRSLGAAARNPPSTPLSTTAGIDFGTTNTSIALVRPDATVDLALFPLLGATTASYRSLLYFEQAPRQGIQAAKTFCWTGPLGIEHYLAAEHQGRLIQSLKSFLADRHMDGTQVFERKRTVEDLIARILTDVREGASRQFGVDVRRVTVGRPVRFVGSTSDDDDAYAVARLERAFHAAGFEDVAFELEPIAAAFQYESTLDHDELILIGDFGGGTSDFSLIHVGPGAHQPGASRRLLGNAGIGLAGDAFDAQIIRKLVSPALGSRGEIQSMHKLLPMPAWPYSNLERWHHLSFLKTREVIDQLERLQAQAIEPEPVAALLHLIRHDLGYQLHRAVQQVKTTLSIEPSATFTFRDGSLLLEDAVTREDFEGWIADELAQIETCVDGLLTSAGVAPPDVDAVFLTGGTSLVPIVRRIFESRFGASRVATGNEFTSVAMGLARAGARRA